MKLVKLRCMAKENPIQVDRIPFFSWQIEAIDEYDIIQKAYQITVEDVDGKLFWNSGKVDSDETLQMSYQGLPLEADTRYIWKVISWTGNDPEQILSAESWFETGLLRNGWTAKWIGYDTLPEGMQPFDPQAPFYCADDFMLGENQYYLPPAPYLRKEFTASAAVVRAKIYVTAQGIVDVHVNGKEITKERLIPGTADYDHVAWSKCYDITNLVKEGANAMGIILADGWYAGYIGLHNREWYGSRPRVRMQLVLTYENGKKETVITDESWKAAYGGVLEADIFEGECLDASKEPAGYDMPGFDDTSWHPVETGTEHDVPVEAHPGAPIIAYDSFEAADIDYRSEDDAMIDLGKLIAGVLRLTLSGKKGARVQIRHAEILNDKGELHLDGNRSARVMDTFILNGDREEVFEPKLTYHGFRYAHITGLKEVKILRAEGIQIGSELGERTVFETTDETINQVYDVCLETMLDNVMDNPTDVCARDERLGWGNEGNHSIYDMSVYGDMECFIRKWNEDIWSSQHADGGLEPIAPPLMMKDVEQYSGDLQTNHGIHMLYALYKLYGDRAVIREYYPKMVRFMEYLDHNSDRNIRFGTTGDWLGIWESTGHSDVNHGYGDCSPGIIGTTHYAFVINMMSEMADAIGQVEDAAKYRALYADVKKAFTQNFVQRDGTIRFGKQGEYVLGLASGLIPENCTDTAAAKLREMLYETGRIFWKGGTPSTPYFLSVLAKYGMKKEAIEFLSSREFPSIAYMIDNGPGTVWERWDGIWEDGTIHPHVMNAMSHLGLTMVDEYLVSGLAGIQPVSPGYHSMKIAPAAAQNLQGLKCVYQSKSGPVGVAWKMEEKQFTACIDIPANTQAYVTVPCMEGSMPVCDAGTIKDPVWENGMCTFTAGSGSYRLRTCLS